MHGINHLVTLDPEVRNTHLNSRFEEAIKSIQGQLLTEELPREFAVRLKIMADYHMGYNTALGSKWKVGEVYSLTETHVGRLCVALVKHNRKLSTTNREVLAEVIESLCEQLDARCYLDQPGTKKIAEWENALFLVLLLETIGLLLSFRLRVLNELGVGKPMGRIKSYFVNRKLKTLLL